MAVDDGYVSLFGNERGPSWYNHFNEEQHNLGGGYSYLVLPPNATTGGYPVYCSAYQYAPSASLPSATRRFGIGYYHTSTVLGNDLSSTSASSYRVEHLIYAPFGDDPLLIDEVTITRLPGGTNGKEDISHVEYWDVNRYQLVTEWVRTGDAAPPGNVFRDELNSPFFQEVTFDASRRSLVAKMHVKPDVKDIPSRQNVSDIDWYPADMFLMSLDKQNVFDAVFTDQRSFFGYGLPVSEPIILLTNSSGGLLPRTEAFGQPAMFGVRTDLSLAENDAVTLNFAYGYLPKGFTLDQLYKKYAPSFRSSWKKKKSKESSTMAGKATAKGSSLFLQSMKQWKEQMASITLPPDFPSNMQLQREVQWRSAQLVGMSTYHDYYSSHVISQGSAYLYLHGADGVPRDQSLFTLAMTYLNPSLAKETLKLIMQTCDAEVGSMTYAFVGHGVNSDALGLHSFPSDLDIYLFFAIHNYLTATGDWAFLNDTLNFHPRDSATLPPGAKGKTVLDHLRAAFVHLTTQVGIGYHGLVKIGDGDWDDGVVYSSGDPLAIFFTIEDGESIPNSQMAVVAISHFADAAQGHVDQQFISDLRSYANALINPVRNTFGTQWFGRAWVKDEFDAFHLLGNDGTDDGYAGLLLQGQPWGLLIPGLLQQDQIDGILDQIETQLDADSPIGPRLAAGGQVWPAISQLMTWVWMAHDHFTAAWNNIRKHLYATHANSFPKVWLGIMSGPDGWISTGSSYPGGTWASIVTPMTDFPVSNANPDAMFLFGVMKGLALDSVADGLRLNLSRIPFDQKGSTFGLKTPLLTFNATESNLVGRYHAFNDGTVILHVIPPQGMTIAEPKTKDEEGISIPLRFKKGQTIPFSVTFTKVQ